MHITNIPFSDELGHVGCAQVEADIRPFRGLLLGLFFVTTGTQIDVQVRRSQN